MEGVDEGIIAIFYNEDERLETFCKLNRLRYVFIVLVL